MQPWTKNWRNNYKTLHGTYHRKWPLENKNRANLPVVQYFRKMNSDHESTEYTVFNVQISNFNDAPQPEIRVSEMKETLYTKRFFSKELTMAAV